MCLVLGRVCFEQADYGGNANGSMRPKEMPVSVEKSRKSSNNLPVSA